MNLNFSNPISISSNVVTTLTNISSPIIEALSKENSTVDRKGVVNPKEPKKKPQDEDINSYHFASFPNKSSPTFETSSKENSTLFRKRVSSEEPKNNQYNPNINFSTPLSVSSNYIATFSNKSSPAFEAFSKGNGTIFGISVDPEVQRNNPHDMNVNFSNSIQILSDGIAKLPNISSPIIEDLSKGNSTNVGKGVVHLKETKEESQARNVNFFSPIPVSSDEVTTFSNKSSATLETLLSKGNSTLSGTRVDSKEPKNNQYNMNINFSNPLSVSSNNIASLSNKFSEAFETSSKENRTIFGESVDSRLPIKNGHGMNLNFSNPISISSNDVTTLSNISVPIVGALSNENSAVVGESVIDPKKPKKNNEHDMNLNFSNPISISSNVVTTLTNISSPIIEAISKENSTVDRKGVVNPKEPKKKPQDEDINSNHFASFPNKSSPTFETSSKENSTLFRKRVGSEEPKNNQYNPNINFSSPLSVSSNYIATFSNKSSPAFEAFSKGNGTIFGISVDPEVQRNNPHDMNVNFSNSIQILSDGIAKLPNISSPIIEDLSKGNSTNVGKGVVHLKETKKESQARNVNFFSPIPISSDEVTTFSNKSSETLETLSKGNSTLSGTRVDSKEPKNNQYNMNINFSNPLSVSSNNIASLSNKFSKAFETSSKENQSVDSRLPIKNGHGINLNFSNPISISSNDVTTLSNISVPIVGALSNENSTVVGEGVIDPKEPKKNNEHDTNLNFSNPISISSNVVTTLTNISSPIIEALSKENSTVVRKGVVNPKEPKKKTQDENINSNHFASFPNKYSPTFEALSKVNRTIFGESVDSESDMNLNSSNPILISSNNVITLSNISSPIIEDSSRENSTVVGKDVLDRKETKKGPENKNDANTISNAFSPTLETLSKESSTLFKKDNSFGTINQSEQPLKVSMNKSAGKNEKFAQNNLNIISKGGILERPLASGRRGPSAPNQGDLKVPSADDDSDDDFLNIPYTNEDKDIEEIPSSKDASNKGDFNIDESSREQPNTNISESVVSNVINKDGIDDTLAERIPSKHMTNPPITITSTVTPHAINKDETDLSESTSISPFKIETIADSKHIKQSIANSQNGTSTKQTSSTETTRSTEESLLPTNNNKNDSKNARINGTEKEDISEFTPEKVTTKKNQIEISTKHAIIYTRTNEIDKEKPSIQLPWKNLLKKPKENKIINEPPILLNISNQRPAIRPHVINEPPILINNENKVAKPPAVDETTENNKQTEKPKFINEPSILIDDKNQSSKAQVIDELPILVNNKNETNNRKTNTETTNNNYGNGTKESKVIDEPPILIDNTSKSTSNRPSTIKSHQISQLNSVTADVTNFSAPPIISVKSTTELNNKDNKTEELNNNECNGESPSSALTSGLKYGAMGGAAGGLGAVLAQIVKLIQKKQNKDDSNNDSKDKKNGNEETNNADNTNGNTKSNAIDQMKQTLQDDLDPNKIINNVEQKISDTEDEILGDITNKVNSVEESVMDSIKGRLVDTKDALMNDLKMQILHGNSGSVLTNIKTVFTDSEHNIFKNVKDRLTVAKSDIMSDVKSSFESAIEKGETMTNIKSANKTEDLDFKRKLSETTEDLKDIDETETKITGMYRSHIPNVELASIKERMDKTKDVIMQDVKSKLEEIETIIKNGVNTHIAYILFTNEDVIERRISWPFIANDYSDQPSTLEIVNKTKKLIHLYELESIKIMRGQTIRTEESKLIVKNAGIFNMFKIFGRRKQNIETISSRVEMNDKCDGYYSVQGSRRPSCENC
ncbi:hypothetical protein HHI36_017617 [Cryptolaemus montrouzieri]|uniref:Uncharacterized protein n=1 Tax=Cryptolaemus montrouzieri TaxID=559131 RepID=A0ABD2NN15_9CUCU